MFETCMKNRHTPYVWSIAYAVLDRVYTFYQPMRAAVELNLSMNCMMGVRWERRGGVLSKIVLAYDWSIAGLLNTQTCRFFCKSCRSLTQQPNYSQSYSSILMKFTIFTTYISSKL